MNIKTNKGFSLIEVLVTMGLIGVLTAIAIPAYKNYRKNANDTVLKADSGNGYKAYHAYNAVNGSFCAGLDTVGLSGLKNSTTYTATSFVGFDSSDCTPAISDIKHDPGGNNPFATVTACKLSTDSFLFAVANKFEGDKAGFYVTNGNGSPKSSSGSCSGGQGGVATACTNKADCIDATKSCNGADTTTAGVWADSTTLCN